MGIAAAIGIDLAWSDRNRSGCVALDMDGAILDERLLGSDEEILTWIDTMAADRVVVAVDAPLLVPNETGRRPCESDLHRVYGARKAGPHSSNRALLIRNNGRMRGEDLRVSLEASGFHDPWANSDRTLIEVYPHPALIEVFLLDERLMYKKGPVTMRRQGLRRLEELMAGLSDADPPLSGKRIDIPSDLRGQALKDQEDILDGRMCAWIAALWNQYGEKRIELYGSSDLGHVAVPKTAAATTSARQRKSGPAQRGTSGARS